ncbi:MAG: serine/threonine protein kinase [Anaerolineales bacterium]|nr:MAG: serine/threonine protein kinase [Anaerolineales bacterium]
MQYPLESGQILRDRYIIRRIIGRGGMGSIYLAEDNRLPGRLCALKEVKYDINLPAETLDQGREQFYREASLLARLDHPNLPKVSDFFSDLECDYLVMDYVPGEDLKTLLDHTRRDGSFLAQTDVLTWASQLTDALEYLHNQPSPVIHRDIKPSNLKLTPSGLLKLVDFGLVKQLVPDEMTITVIQGRGTASYTPLEQYGGDSGHTDVRSDIYAFGATLYHLLTNQTPAEAKQRFLKPGALRPLRDLNPDIAPTVESAVLWAMELHPDKRPQNIKAFRQALLENVPTGHFLLHSPSAFVQPFLLSAIDRLLAATAVILLLVAAIATFQ